ncbi:MAG: MopE-related protein [bacterium]
MLSSPRPSQAQSHTPVIDSLSPQSGYAGESTLITLYGHNFSPDTLISLYRENHTPRSTYATPDLINGLYVVGDYAYLAAGEAGLLILDISDPEHPMIKGSFDTPGEAQAVYVRGDYAFLADWDEGLEIIDVSDPENPVLKKNYDLEGLAHSLSIDGNYAYIAAGYDGLQIIDITDPNNPSSKGSFGSSDSSNHVHVQGEYAYVADEDAGLQIIDVHDPSKPILKGSYDTAGVAWHVQVSGDYAYVADLSGGLQIIDIRDPNCPNLAGRFNTPGMAYEVQVTGNYAYVADYGCGLHVIDIRIPACPLAIANVILQDEAYGILVSHDRIYLTLREAGLCLLSRPCFFMALPTEVAIHGRVLGAVIPPQVPEGMYTIRAIDPEAGVYWLPDAFEMKLPPVCEHKIPYYHDQDHDSYGDPNDFLEACFPPPGYSENNHDCDDNDAATYPGAPEYCDGKDNNCDGRADEVVSSQYYYEDYDGDGFGNSEKGIEDCKPSPGYVMNHIDCDDTDIAIHPEALEVNDGYDNDCDERTDEGEEFHIYEGRSIQSAIYGANDGDVIIIHRGTYYEVINFLGKAITLMSTDPNDPEIVANTVINGRQAGSVVVFESGEGNDSRLIGMTVENGHGDAGGGIDCENSSPFIKNCIIRNNWSPFGGGIYCEDSSPALVNCTIAGNSAHFCGGGIYIHGADSTLHLDNCFIVNNTAMAGGGIYIIVSYRSKISNCTIAWNSADWFAGGFCCECSLLALVNCVIHNNSAHEVMGGGMYIDDSLPQVTNCTFSENTAAGHGGGIYCTGSSILSITNSILWQDSPNEMYIKSGILNATYSDIQGGYGNPESTHNMDRDPLFVDPNLGNFHLQTISPCLEAGTGNQAPITDRDGVPRPLGAGYDLGAYEFSDIPLQTYYLDADGDGYGDDTLATQAGSYPFGFSGIEGDCDETEPAIHPGASESCDGRDNDCDGHVDEEDARGCLILYKDQDGDGYGIDDDKRCLCSPDEESGYTASQGGDPDDYDPKILGTPGTCMFSATISALGLEVEGYNHESEIIIGISEIPLAVSSLPGPLDYTAQIMIKDSLSFQDYSQLIKQEGPREETWLFSIEVPEAVMNAYPGTYYPRLRWEPTELCSTGIFRLWSSNSDGDLLSLLVSDMSQAADYQTRAGDGSYFCMVWTKDIALSLNLKAGWNMISLPAEPKRKQITWLFPEARAIFDFAGKYVLLDPNDELEIGKGYWVCLPIENTFLITGTPVDHYLISEKGSGWSMIGTTSYSTLLSVSQGYIKAAFGFTGTYESLGSGEVIAPLEPGRGYWINLSDQTNLMIERASQGESGL